MIEPARKKVKNIKTTFAGKSSFCKSGDIIVKIIWLRPDIMLSKNMEILSKCFRPISLFRYTDVCRINRYTAKNII